MFSKYHYLSHTHNARADSYIAIVNGVIAGFISVLNFPHPHIKNMRKVHRLVVMPAYQGVGIGSIMLESIAKMYEGFRFGITTSAPGLIFNLKESKNWRCIHFGRMKPQGKKSTLHDMSISKNRITASFEFKY